MNLGHKFQNDQVESQELPASLLLSNEKQRVLTSSTSSLFKTTRLSGVADIHRKLSFIELPEPARWNNKASFLAILAMCLFSTHIKEAPGAQDPVHVSGFFLFLTFSSSIFSCHINLSPLWLEQCPAHRDGALLCNHSWVFLTLWSQCNYSLALLSLLFSSESCWCSGLPYYIVHGAEHGGLYRTRRNTILDICSGISSHPSQMAPDWLAGSTSKPIYHELFFSIWTFSLPIISSSKCFELSILYPILPMSSFLWK